MGLYFGEDVLVVLYGVFFSCFVATGSPKRACMAGLLFLFSILTLTCTNNWSTFLSCISFCMKMGRLMRARPLSGWPVCSCIYFGEQTMTASSCSRYGMFGLEASEVSKERLLNLMMPSNVF